MVSSLKGLAFGEKVANIYYIDPCMPFNNLYRLHPAREGLSIIVSCNKYTALHTLKLIAKRALYTISIRLR
jgi:hypothetical protein